MRRLIIITLLAIPLHVAHSQIMHFTAQEAIDRIYDLLSEDDAIVDYDAIFQQLYQLQQNPIDLNSATPQQLKELIVLSDQQIENLCYYRYRADAFKTPFELQLVQGFDPFTISLILPFVTILPLQSTKEPLTEPLKTALRNGTHRIDSRFVTTLEQKKGYKTTHPPYSGLPFDALLRYRFNASDRIWLGISAQKDAGEPLYDNRRLDMASYHLYAQYNGTKWLKTAVVGHYRAGFGHGLIFGSAFRTGKTGEVLPSATNEVGLRRLSSLTEYQYLQGAGAQFQFGKLSLSLLYSIMRLDADTTGGSISSIKQDGNFRTATEMAQRHTVLQQVAGAHAQYRYRFLTVGATLYAAFLNVPMQPPAQIYAAHHFSGTRQGALSVNYRLRFPQWQFWGETSLSHRAAPATLNALEFSPAAVITFTLLYRYYSPQYHLFMANGFSESGNVTNEEGLYLAMRLLPLSPWSITLYADLFRFPYLRYGNDAPTHGYDLFMQNNVILNPNLLLQCRIRYRQRQEFSALQQLTRERIEAGTALLRLDLIYSQPQWRTRSLVQATRAHKDRATAQYGWLLMQEGTWTPTRPSLSLTARFEMFDAPSFDARLYCFETDIPTLYYTPFLYGSGCRYYLLLRYRYKKMLTVAARLAQTIYTDSRTTIGTGYESIAGRHKTDVSIYLMWQFTERTTLRNTAIIP